MLSFSQYLTESADQEYHAWYQHPTYGVIHAPGMSAHEKLARQHHFDDVDQHPRGWFMVNKKEKKTYIKPYDWTGHANTKEVSSSLRRVLKVPVKFEHKDLSAPAKKRTYFESAEKGFVRGLPPAPGTASVPEGHIRLYHQTSEAHLPSIEKHGIRMDHARGIEGPRSVWADPEGFYGDPSDKPTVEFHIPKTEWHGNGQVPRSIEPHEIIGVHYPWHRHARYAVNRNLIPDIKAGKFDKHLTGNSKTATDHIKAHY